MKKYLQSVRRMLTWERWQFLYIILSLSWLLAPGVNGALSTKDTFISQYEDPGQPWSLLFRTCDVLAAALLGLAVLTLVRRKHLKFRWRDPYVQSLVLLGIIALGSFIDAVFPSTCHGGFCIASARVLSDVHADESVITSICLLLVNLVWAVRKVAWARPAFLVQLIWVSIFLVNRFTSRAPAVTLAQFGYEIVIILWIAWLIPYLAGRLPIRAGQTRNSLMVHAITAWIFVSGFLTIMTAIRNVREISHLSAVYFGDNTAWISQHGIVVGIILMYISRHLWRGEYRAWQLALALLWLETLKYAVLSPNGALALLYGLTAALLFVKRGSFDRLTSTEELRERLKKLLLILAAVLAAVCAGVIAFRLKHHQDLDSLRINPARIARHLFLFDEVNDFGPLPRRLMGQVLNAAGLALLLTILVSLFKPQKPLLHSGGENDREELLGHLAESSNSSEDFFKYWPLPKSYWHGNAGAVVAYRVMGNVAFALADPVIRGDKAREKAAAEFMSYCRGRGWLACFIMVSENSRAFYRKAGYKSLRIGASAKVDIARFATETSRNKWWRWVLNKAKRQEWEYQFAAAPHSPDLFAELRQVSDSWMKRQNHVERGFALGYFDDSYLQKCRLHLLRHEGKVIAFANELPTFNNIPSTTIDLMRFLPDYGHAMPTLLAHTIRQLHEEDAKRVFDLGFVPLASPEGRGEQLVRQFGRILLSESVSAQGLEQFKNKFDPSWAGEYIAFDGDWIDLVHISRQLDNLLKVS